MKRPIRPFRDRPVSPRFAIRLVFFLLLAATIASTLLIWGTVPERFRLAVGLPILLLVIGLRALRSLARAAEDATNDASRRTSRHQDGDRRATEKTGHVADGGLRESTRELTQTAQELRHSLRRALRLLADRKAEALRPLTKSSSFEIRSAVATIERILPHDKHPSSSRKDPKESTTDPGEHRASAVTTSEDDAFTKRAHSAIEASMHTGSFNVEVLARQLGMDRSHLYRRMHSLFGCSPSRMIREIRLKHAARMLRKQSGTVSEIAYRVGFKSLAHFSNAFRKRYRVPPSRYAKSLERDPD